MLQALTAYFQRSDTASVMLELQQWSNWSQGQRETTEQYYIRTLNKAAKLALLNVTPPEYEKINRFLTGYKGPAIIRQIVMAQNLPTLMDVGTAVISQERAEQGHKVNAALHSTAQGAAARAFHSELEESEANAARFGTQRNKEGGRGKPKKRSSGC